MALPWMQIIKGGTEAVDGQSGGSAQGGKGGIFSKIGARSNMPKEATMGLASGLFQSLQAARLKKAANSAAPSLIDPRQASFLSELNQKRKSIDTGAAFQTGMNAIDTTNEATNEALTRNTGGNTAGTIQALLQAQRGAGDAKNSVIGQGQGQQLAYNSMFNQLNNQIAGRTLQLQMQKSQQLRAEWAQKQQVANQNLMAGVAGLMEQKQNYGKPDFESNPGATDITSAKDPDSAFNTGWSFKGKTDTTPETPNQVPQTVMTGDNAPTTSSNVMDMVKNGTQFMSK